MKFTDKTEPETCTEECTCEDTTFNVMRLSDFRVQMVEGDMLDQFLIFLNEGETLFAKYGFLTYDNKGIRSITISSEIDEEIVDYDKEQDFDTLLYTAFQEEEHDMITFDVSFLSDIHRLALTNTVKLYMRSNQEILNEALGADEEA